jgi:phosphopantetheinyl transferase (holo-ACP synthase)
MLAVAYAEVGRRQEARAEAARVFRINPEFSVARQQPPKDAALAGRWATDLKEAGFKVVCVKFSKKLLWAYGRVKLRARSGALRESSA